MTILQPWVTELKSPAPSGEALGQPQDRGVGGSKRQHASSDEMKTQREVGPGRWGFGVGAWEAGRASPFVLSFLRSLGTRSGAWLGDLGIRQFPGLPQKYERLGSERGPPDMSYT